MPPFRQRSAAAASTPSGAPPMPITACTLVPRTAAEMPAERSPSPISLMRAPGGADVGDQLLVPLAIEHDDDEVVDVAAEALGDRLQVRLDRRVEVDDVARRRPDDDLLHVAVGRVQQAALVRRRQHGDGARRAGGAEVGALERIDGDVDLEVARRPSGPTCSPMNSIGASSRSPSPMTTVPRIGSVSIALRIASTATWSEYLRFALPHGAGRLDGGELAHAQEVAGQRSRLTARLRRRCPSRCAGSRAPRPACRWKELRPMIEPKPPPSRMARISSMIAAVSFASPPEKMTMRRPAKALCTTCRTRSASVPIGNLLLLVDLLARRPARCAPSAASP